MRGLVLTLLNSLPSMLNILLLFVFTLVIFGTIGVQLFKGIFIPRCVLSNTINEEDWSSEEYLTNRDGEEMFCQIGEAATVTCPDSYVCLERENPGVGFQNWDNIFYALLTQFELITLEGWSDVMYKVRNANNGSKLQDAFFVLSVVFGAFFVLNLMIAVQFKFLDEAIQEVKEQELKDRQIAEAEARDAEEQ